MSDKIHSISVALITPHCNPLEKDPWNGGVTRETVERALKEQRFNAVSFQSTKEYGDTYDHSARIAFLIVQGWKDAISIDVGVPSLGCMPEWLVDDGNHRLAAAIYRNDNEIICAFSGSLDLIKELFGV